MKHKSMLRVLSVLLVLCAFLPSFSLHSSAADVNASAYGFQATTNQYYFTTSGDVITERYTSTFDFEFDKLPFDIFIDNDFPDVSAEVSCILMNVTFTDDQKFYNTNYRVQFDIDQPAGSAHKVHMYAFTVPETYDISSDIINVGDLIVSNSFFPFMNVIGSYNVGDVFTTDMLINSINASMINNFGSRIFDHVAIKYATIIENDTFVADIFIPDNQATVYSMVHLDPAEYGERMPRTLRLAFVITRNSDERVNNFTIKNFSLIPIKGTEQYYKDDIFQNDVIGSDEDGNESGIRGILAYVKKLPSLIMEKLKELFVPDDDFLNNTLVDMDAFMIQHLGILYQAPKELIELISDFVSLDVPYFEDVGYYTLKMPAFSLYVNVDPPPGQDIIYSNIDTDFQDSPSNLSSYVRFDVLPDNSYFGEDEGFYLRLDFLSKQPFNILYNIYRVFSYAFVIVIFLLYAYRRFNAVLGGLGSS